MRKPHGRGDILPWLGGLCLGLLLTCVWIWIVWWAYARPSPAAFEVSLATHTQEATRIALRADALLARLTQQIERLLWQEAVESRRAPLVCE